MIALWGCARYQSLLVDYADDAVVDRDRRRVAAHLQECASCRSDLAALRTLPEQLRQCEAPDPGEEAWAAQRLSIADAIRHVPQPRPRWSWLPVMAWQPTLAAFASLFLAIGIYRYTIHRNFHKSIEPTVTSDVLGLDAPTFDHLLEVMAVLMPADEYLLRPAADGDAGDSPLSTLDDDELDGLADLVGVS